MPHDPSDAAIVRSTIDLAHNLGLQVVAEGVESHEAWRRLAELGCDLAQGFHVSRPLPADAMTRLLVERRNADPARGRAGAVAVPGRRRLRLVERSKRPAGRRVAVLVERAERAEHGREVGFRRHDELGGAARLGMPSGPRAV